MTWPSIRKVWCVHSLPLLLPHVPPFFSEVICQSLALCLERTSKGKSCRVTLIPPWSSPIYSALDTQACTFELSVCATCANVDVSESAAGASWCVIALHCPCNTFWVGPDHSSNW